MPKKSPRAYLPIAALLLITSLIGSQPLPQNKPATYLGNLHTHTTASDGTLSYDAVIRRARRLGIDFIAITDHDTIGPEVLLRCPGETRLKCFIGEEVTTLDGHVLAIGIYEAIPAGLSAAEAIERIHAQGGIAIPAHPSYLSLSLSPSEIERLPFDAVECNVKTKQEPGGGYSCDAVRGLPRIYSSDAHDSAQLDTLASECAMEALDFRSLRAAIAAGECGEYVLASP